MAVTKRLKAVLEAEDRASSVFKRLNRTVDTFVGNFTALMAVKAVAAVRAFVSSTAEIGASFEQSMSKVRAIARPTQGEFAQLERAAREMGRTTVFSAVQAGEALESFALAGFKVKEELGALEPTLNLAAAGELSMGEAASITSRILRTFGLDTKELTDVVDTLAFTATNSNQTVHDMGEAFKFVGSAASTLGVDVNELSSAMAVLADRGISADMAGTGLRRVLVEILKSIDSRQLGDFNVNLKDAQGNFVGLVEALRRMEAAGITANKAFDVFEQRGGTVASILLTNINAVDKFGQSLEGAGGTAEAVGRVKLDNLRGRVTLLKSAFAEMAIVIFKQLSPGLQVLVDGATGVTRTFADATDQSTVLRDGMLSLVEGMITVGEVAVRLLAFFQALGRTAGGALAVSLSTVREELVITLAAIEKSKEAYQILDSVYRQATGSQSALSRSGAKNATVVEELTGLLNDMRQSLDVQKEAAAYEDFLKALAEGGGPVPEIGLNLPESPTVVPQIGDLPEPDLTPYKDVTEEAEEQEHILFRVSETIIKQTGLARDLVDSFTEVRGSLAEMPGLAAEFEERLFKVAEPLKGLNPELDKIIAGIEKRKELEEAEPDILAQVSTEYERQLALSEQLLAAIELATFAYAEQPEKLDIILGMLGDTGLAIEEGVNPALDKWLESMGFVEEATKKGLTLFQELALVMREELAFAAIDLSNTMVDAAFGADVAWDKVLKNIIANLIKAQLQALILRAIMGGATGGGSELAGGFGFDLGGGVLGLQHGGLVPGTDLGVDRVPAMLRPGELVVPKELTDALLEGGAGRGGGGVVVNLNNAFIGEQKVADRLAVQIARSVQRVQRNNLVRSR